MTQTQLLILLTSLIPFASCFIVKFSAINPNSKFAKSLNKLVPVFFLASVIALHGIKARGDNSLIIGEAINSVFFGFEVINITIFFLLLLGFLWLVFACYSDVFLASYQVENSDSFKLFFAAIIACLNLTILSKNLFSILFFYNCLLILSYFFALKFLSKKEEVFPRFFVFLIYLQSILFFLAIVAMHKFGGKTDFAKSGVDLDSVSYAKQTLLAMLFLVGLFLPVIFPSFLFYKTSAIDPIKVYSIFFFVQAFTGFYILTKVLKFAVGIDEFSFVFFGANHGFLFHSFEWIFLFGIGATSLFLLLSKSLRSSFFYLFFQQFTFAFFASLVFATFDESRIPLVLLSFSLSITLIFLCLSNLLLYLSKAQNKSLNSIFYGLKVTSILLVFGVLSLIGITPSIAAIEKFFLIKIIIEKKLLISAIIVAINFISILFFSWKIFFPIFFQKLDLHDEKVLAKDRLLESDLEIAKSIDFDSSLILGALSVAVMMLLSLIFFSPLTKFFS